jgi:hypothetical protein
MKNLFIIYLLLIVSGCSIESHLAKAQKHIDIAKRKGAVITPDTVWQYNYVKETVFDTVTNTYKEILKKDSTISTVNNTISAGMTRQERLALEAQFKHLEKMLKLQNASLSKQLDAAVKINKEDEKTNQVTVKQENKNNWFFSILPWLIIIGYLVYKLAPKYIKIR